MKTNISLKALGVGALLTSSLVLLPSCDDFLDRPTEDNYTADNYYASDAACIAGTNYLYNSPWYDFQRGFIKVGEVFSGNMFWGSSPYLNFSVNGTDQDLINMSYSLWAEIGHCSTVYQSLRNANASQSVKDQCMGECLTWKAMAYFYLVRTFGEIPIVHDNSAMLATGEYNGLKKVDKADVYEYIIMTLEKAMELLPKSSADGRIDYYCAEGLLSKVYLTKAGLSGQLDKTDLQKAADYAKDVIDNSGRTLMENYEDIFRGSNNCCPESLIAWRWTVGAHWTCQNTFQSDLAIVGFDEYGDVWGGWGGPSADLMNAFGVIEMEGHGSTANLKDFPEPKVNKDARRKATMMLPGDRYDYFWRDKTSPSGYKGFDYLEAIYDETEGYGKGFSEQTCQGPCGCNNVKHLYGDEADHVAEMGISAGRMANALATHILRLADIYLIFAESKTLMGQGTDADALSAFNAVHLRAVKGDTITSLSFDKIWKERRLEFAGEGDRWYDFVRRSYYDTQACIDEIKAQYRNQLWACDAMYKNYYDSGKKTWSRDCGDKGYVSYDNKTAIPNVTAASFTLPFPTEDVVLNPNIASSAPSIHIDVRNVYSY